MIGVPKIKSEQSSSLPHFDPLENQQIQRVSEPSPKPNLPKNETPNRFWSFVEPYCAPITPEDIKLLEDLIKGPLAHPTSKRILGSLSQYLKT